MKHILFVDDEMRILEGLKRMLRNNRDRWEMQFASSGEEALRACQAKEFDIVISDMRMPGMDGVAFLGRVRELLPNAARIVLTGYSETKLAIRSVSVAHRALAKPCDPTELQAMLERIIALEELVAPPEIRRIVGAVGELPALSQTYVHLTKAVQDPNASVAQIARIVEKDVALSAKILQLTNSAFFGLPHTVTSITGAVSYLGMETIKNLALVSEAFSAFVPDRRVPEWFCSAIQAHALAAAEVAGKLPVRPVLRDTVVIAALLHDIGELFMASKMPAELCNVLAHQSKEACNRYQVEEQLLGTSHAEIGAYLLGLWGIPKPIVEAVAHHHHLEKAEAAALECAAAVHVADLLAHAQGSEPTANADTHLDETNRACLDQLGFLSWIEDYRASEPGEKIPA